MKPLISGGIGCHVLSTSTLKAHVLNIIWAYEVLRRILCGYFNAFMKTRNSSVDEIGERYGKITRSVTLIVSFCASTSYGRWKLL